MIVKEKFELVYGKMGEIYNVMPMSESSLSAFLLDTSDNYHIMNLAKIYAKSKNHVSSEIVLSKLESVKCVRMPQYPLPGFVSKQMVPYINVATIPTPSASDFSSPDIYSMYLYSIALASFIKNESFQSAIEEHVTNYIFACFMKFYAKRSGLLGSYQDMIPRLRFLIHLYITCSMMGNFDNEATRKKIASKYFIPLTAMKLDGYDFTKIKDLLKAINHNNIVPLSDNIFSTQVVNIGGAASLPIFEDVSRFFATMLAVSVKGNTQFNSYWVKVRPDLYHKIEIIGSKIIRL
jgi:hypothetical protein